MQSREKLFILVVLFACGSVLFRNIDALSLRMWDESRNALNAMEMVRTGNPLVIMYEGQPDLWSTKPPFLAWCMALSMKIFGFNEFAVRLPVVLAALLTMTAAFFFLYRNSEKNILSAVGPLMLASCTGYIDYHAARNGDFDVVLAMWVFGCGICFFNWLHDESGKNKWIYLSAFCLTFGILTKSIAALMIGPGLILYALFAGKIRKLFTSRHVYLAALIGMLPAGLYYGMREFVGRGYIKTVFVNELTSRYLDVNEGHAADFWFYFRDMYVNDLGMWYYVVLVSIAAALLFGRKKPAGRIVLFGTTMALSFMLVISSSMTKLPWYDAPVFPFLALICAGGAMLVWEQIAKGVASGKTLNRFWPAAIFCILLSAYPVWHIHARTSVRATREKTYPELFYGDMIQAFVQAFPQERLTVVYDGYNSHALFYVRAYQMKHYAITAKTSDDAFVTGETLLFCEPAVVEKVRERYQLETVFVNDERLIATVAYRKSALATTRREIASHLVDEKIREIVANPDWKKSVEDKARENNRSFERQLRLDALYVLQQEQKLTHEEAKTLE